jgi:hypothetical protein
MIEKPPTTALVTGTVRGRGTAALGASLTARRAGGYPA